MTKVGNLDKIPINMMIPTNKIKADKNQPRRTFNKEKMASLEASMRADGFREQYPIIINGGNIIVDGERRWRTAKKVGIKQVPVEVKHNVSPYERLSYQLRSEGAELESFDKYEAWKKAYKLGKNLKTINEIAKDCSAHPRTFENIINSWEKYDGVIKVISPRSVKAIGQKQFHLISEVGNEEDPKLRKKLAEKAIKEEWQEKKAREIRRALKERPLREKQILSQDYSDPYEGSSLWKTRLEVAKSDVDIEEIKGLDKTREGMEEQVDAFDRIVEYALKLDAAVKKFDYTLVTPQTRIKLHSSIAVALPNTWEWFQGLTNYMIKNGELTSKSKKLGRG